MPLLTLPSSRDDSWSILTSGVNGTKACKQYLKAPYSNTSTFAFAAEMHVPWASLMHMNGLSTSKTGILPLCAPEACAITINNVRQSTSSFVSQQTTYTLSQFLAWNPYVLNDALQIDESVCVGYAASPQRLICMLIATARLALRIRLPW